MSVCLQLSHNGRSALAGSQRSVKDIPRKRRNVNRLAVDVIPRAAGKKGDVLREIQRCGDGGQADEQEDDRIWKTEFLLLAAGLVFFFCSFRCSMGVLASVGGITGDGSFVLHRLTQKGGETASAESKNQSGQQEYGEILGKGIAG